LIPLSLRPYIHNFKKLKFKDKIWKISTNSRCRISRSQSDLLTIYTYTTQIGLMLFDLAVCILLIRYNHAMPTIHLHLSTKYGKTFKLITITKWILLKKKTNWSVVFMTNLVEWSSETQIRSYIPKAELLRERK
jgi:hypothetical protein